MFEKTNRTQLDNDKASVSEENYNNMTQEDDLELSRVKRPYNKTPNDTSDFANIRNDPIFCWVNNLMSESDMNKNYAAIMQSETDAENEFLEKTRSMNGKKINLLSIKRESLFDLNDLELISLEDNEKLSYTNKSNNKYVETSTTTKTPDSSSLNKASDINTSSHTTSNTTHLETTSIKKLHTKNEDKSITSNDIVSEKVEVTDENEINHELNNELNDAMTHYYQELKAGNIEIVDKSQFKKSDSDEFSNVDMYNAGDVDVMNMSTLPRLVPHNPQDLMESLEKDSTSQTRMSDSEWVDQLQGLWGDKKKHSSLMRTYLEQDGQLDGNDPAFSDPVLTSLAKLVADTLYEAKNHVQFDNEGNLSLGDDGSEEQTVRKMFEDGKNLNVTMGTIWSEGLHDLVKDVLEEAGKKYVFLLDAQTIRLTEASNDLISGNNRADVNEEGEVMDEAERNNTDQESNSEDLSNLKYFNTSVNSINYGDLNLWSLLLGVAVVKDNHDAEVQEWIRERLASVMWQGDVEAHHLAHPTCTFNVCGLICTNQCKNLNSNTQSSLNVTNDTDIQVKLDNLIYTDGIARGNILPLLAHLPRTDDGDIEPEHLDEARSIISKMYQSNIKSIDVKESDKSMKDKSKVDYMGDDTNNDSSNNSINSTFDSNNFNSSPELSAISDLDREMILLLMARGTMMEDVKPNNSTHTTSSSNMSDFESKTNLDKKENTNTDMHNITYTDDDLLPQLNTFHQNLTDAEEDELFALFTGKSNFIDDIETNTNNTSNLNINNFNNDNFANTSENRYKDVERMLNSGTKIEDLFRSLGLEDKKKEMKEWGIPETYNPIDIDKEFAIFNP